MANNIMTVGKTTKTERKEEKTMKYTKAQYSKNYKLTYKEYNIVRKIAFIVMQNKNNKIYNDKTVDPASKRFYKYDEIYKAIIKKPTTEIQDLIDRYQEHQEKQELIREGQVIQREQELKAHQEQVDKYFKRIQEIKTHNLETFINRIKGTPEERTKALNWFNTLSYAQQESVINKVDNYLFKQQHEETEIATSYIENM